MHDAEFARKLGHSQDALDGVSQHITAEGFKSALHFHIDKTTRLGLVAETMQLVVIAITR